MDGGERVRRIDPHGIITTIAGNGKAESSGDGGPARRAGLHTPYGLALDQQGNIYVSEFEGCRVRRIDRHGVIMTVAGSGTCGFSGDGGPATKAELARELHLRRKLSPDEVERLIGPLLTDERPAGT